MKSNEKHCPQCDTTKLRSEFHTDRRRKDGLQNICGDCNKANTALQYEREKESGIYILECVIAGQTYVGQTTLGLGKRHRQHRSAALARKVWMTTPTEALPPVQQCIRQFPEKGWWRMRWLAKMPGATTEELLEAEKQFIADIRPTLNVTHNPDKDSRI